jgi:hypothetical protein
VLLGFFWQESGKKDFEMLAKFWHELAVLAELIL